MSGHVVRVAQVVHNVDLTRYGGGAEAFALRLARALNPARVERHVIALHRFDSQAERAMIAALEADGVRVSLGAPHRDDLRTNTRSAARALRDAAHVLQLDIVDTHAELADLAGALAKLRGMRARLVRSCHNILEWPWAPVWRGRTRLLYPLLCDAETGVARGICADLDRRPLARLLRRRAQFIPNAIAAHFFDAASSARNDGSATRAALGIDVRAPFFLAIGRLEAQKDFATLIDAHALLRATRPDAALCIAGDGPERAALEARISAAGQQAHIRLLGQRTDAPALLRACDALVSSSRHEGLPTVVIEAMASRRPVIGTDIGGTNELIQPRLSGLLAPPGDPAALAREMAWLLAPAHRDVIVNMIAAAQTIARAYSIDGTATAYKRLYLQLVGRITNSE